MNDVTKGFRDGRFLSLSERDQRDVLKLMARVAEQAYRRGAQQGAGLAQRPFFRADLGEWRYKPSLDLSPWIDRPRLTTSLERLDGECGEELRRIGLPLKDMSSQSPTGNFMRDCRVFSASGGWRRARGSQARSG